MKKFFVYLLPIFLVSGISAQKNFTPGFVVLNTGDTVRGEIDYGSWPKNPEIITFRAEGQKQTYSVGQLKSFSINNEVFFVRFHVSYQLSAAELADAQESFDGPVESKEVWLRLLFGGKYSLYELSIPKRNYFFFWSDKGGLKELIYRVRLNSTGVLEKDEQYKNLLASYAVEAGCESAVQKKLSRAFYEDEDLLDVFNILNGGSGSFKESGPPKTRFDVSAGGSFYSFATSGDLFNDGSGAYAIYTATFKSTMGFIVGAGLTYLTKRNRGKVQSRIGLNLGSLNINGENNTGTGSFQKEKYSGTLLIAEPNASIDLLLTGNKKLNALLGFIFGYNIVFSNTFSSTFENPGVIVNRDNFPDVGGGFLSVGINGTLSGTWGRLNLRANKVTNIFNTRLTTLDGIQVSLTYGYFLRK